MPSLAENENDVEGNTAGTLKKRKRNKKPRRPDPFTITETHTARISGFSLYKDLGNHEPIASEKFSVGGLDWVLLFYPDGVRTEQSMERGKAIAEEWHRKRADELNNPRPPKPARVAGEPMQPRARKPKVVVPNDMKKPTNEHTAIFLANVGESGDARGVMYTERGRVIRARHSFTLVSQDQQEDPEKRVQSITRARRPDQPFEELLLAFQDRHACQQQDYKAWTHDPFADNCFGYRKFVKRKLIKREQHGFLKNDCILIHYRMELFISESVPSNPSLQLEAPKSRMGRDLLRLWKNGRGGDVSFHFPEEDVDPIWAHSCLMEARFKQNPLPSMGGMRPVWVVFGIDSWVFRSVLYFIYTDQLPEGTSFSEVADVLGAARKLRLPSLLRVCEDILIQNLEVETLPEILQVAYIYDACALQTACLTFASEHLSTIMMTAAFKRLIEPQKELMDLILRFMAYGGNADEGEDLRQQGAKKQRMEKEGVGQ